MAGFSGFMRRASERRTRSCPLCTSLKRRHPALNLLLTTITATSAKIAATRLPEGRDPSISPAGQPAFLQPVHRALAPDLGLFTESEIWPNLIVEASNGKVPLVLLNARMSPRSYKRWSRLSSLAKPLFSRFDLVLTQNWRFAKRLTALGVRKTEITGNLKYDAPPPPVDAAAMETCGAALETGPYSWRRARIPARTRSLRGCTRCCTARCRRS